MFGWVGWKMVVIWGHHTSIFCRNFFPSKPKMCFFCNKTNIILGATLTFRKWFNFVNTKPTHNKKKKRAKTRKNEMKLIEKMQFFWASRIALYKIENDVVSIEADHHFDGPARFKVIDENMHEYKTTYLTKSLCNRYTSFQSQHKYYCV